MIVKPKITELLKHLNDGVYEKEEAIALTLLSSVAGESIFLLGAPGVAKSLIARRLKFAFKDGTSFDYLMNRFSTPDEIFGPVSISQLKDHDKYERIVKNYLPTATVVFLDEIWKAGPSIQNALLTVLNEKVFRNGEQEIRVPMKALIAASNELPSKGEGLEALWDRFLVRFIVEGVQDPKNFNEMISKSLNSYADTIGTPLKISDEEYNKWSKEIELIELPDNVFNVIHIIRSTIEIQNKKHEKRDKDIYVSDRRWRKITRLLRTSAFLNDRKSVDLMDCFLIANCLWNEPEQLTNVTQIVKDAIQKHGYNKDLNLTHIRDEIKEFNEEVKRDTSFLKPIKSEIPKVHYNEYYCVSELPRTLIKIESFKKLTKENQYVDFYYDTSDEWRRSSNKQQLQVKKSDKKNHVTYNGQDYKVDVTLKDDRVTASMKPNPKLQKIWDSQVSKILTATGILKEQIQSYRETDLKHLRVNLFVNPTLAELVESNLNETQKEIEKLEIETRNIQNYYEKIEDQSDKEIKQLSIGKEN